MIKANHPRTVSICAIMIAMASMAACASAPAEQQKRVTVSDTERSSRLLGIVQEINKKAPDSYSAQFTVEGVFGKSKFNSIGEALYNRNPRMARYTFFDIVFKSPLTILVQDGATLKFYFPAEKTLYLDSMETINLKNYAAIDIDFGLIYPFAAGHIPILDGHSIKQGLVAENDSTRSYLVLENRDYFQTISFSGDLPDKILFIAKSNRKKTEFYLEKPHRERGGLFYRKIRMLAPESGGRLSFSFSEIRYDARMDAATMLKINLNKGTKIVNMQ
ncbi:MAG TPA: hypothetical protein VLM75_13925 [Spirochaetota bacterium]|nr:hypothetical protein [Spirochaetota bacterium]